MSITHGVSIHIDRKESHFFIELMPVGTLTHEDYQIMVPMIENAVKDVEDAKVDILIDGRLFTGLKLTAMWDDFKFGIKNMTLFNKIAFIGDKDWEEYAIKMANWFTLGQIRYFEHKEDALEWLSLTVPTDVALKNVEQRREAIENELESLFKKHLTITDLNIPENNDQQTAEALIEIISNKLDRIKRDIKEGKYQNG